MVKNLNVFKEEHWKTLKLLLCQNLIVLPITDICLKSVLKGFLGSAKSLDPDLFALL